MLAKEWWNARWKLALAVLAVLAFVAVTPKSYAMIQDDLQFEIRMMRAQLESPESFMGPGPVPPGYTTESYEEEMRDEIERMQRPDYAADMAGMEMMDLQMGTGYVILVPVAALLGVALVSGEVSRGTVFLLLSRPISRTRILLTKYLVSVAVLFAVALFGGLGIVVSGKAHGYPAVTVDAAQALVSVGSFWLGTVSVLGVALLVSVIFRDVVRSVIATAVTLCAMFYLPDLLRGVAWWLSPPPREYLEGPMMQEGWYETFETFRITNYWFIMDVYGEPFVSEHDPVLKLLVCLIAAALPLIAALWLFRRNSY